MLRSKVRAQWTFEGQNAWIVNGLYEWVEWVELSTLSSQPRVGLNPDISKCGNGHRGR